MEGWIGWKEGYIKKGWMDRQMDGCTDRWMDGWMARMMEGRVD